MMPFFIDQSVRSTLTLDEDVAAKFRDESRRTGRSFRDVVKDVARDPGDLRPGVRFCEPFLGKKPEKGSQNDCVGPGP